jgi:hypothetical protein
VTARSTGGARRSAHISKENEGDVMKKLAILVVACALSIGAVACSKKNAATTPTGDTTGEVTGGETGGATYGGDAYGAPADPAAEGGEVAPE